MIKDELKNMTKEELIAEYERLNDKYVIAEVVKKGLQEEVDRLYEVKLDLEDTIMQLKQELEERMAKMELDETIIPKLAVVDAILEVSNG